MEINKLLGKKKQEAKACIKVEWHNERFTSWINWKKDDLEMLRFNNLKEVTNNRDKNGEACVEKRWVFELSLKMKISIYIYILLRWDLNAAKKKNITMV